MATLRLIPGRRGGVEVPPRRRFSKRRRQPRRAASIGAIDLMIGEVLAKRGEWASIEEADESTAPTLGEWLAAWEREREFLIDSCADASAGRRPVPFWIFDATDPSPPEWRQLPCPTLDGWMDDPERHYREVRAHHDAEWEQEQELLRYLAENGHLTVRELEVLLDGRRLGGDEVCHAIGPGCCGYQWPDAVSAGVIEPHEVIDKPAVRAAIVRRVRVESEPVE
jgi:hypothetical protein